MGTAHPTRNARTNGGHGLGYDCCEFDQVVTVRGAGFEVDIGGVICYAHGRERRIRDKFRDKFFRAIFREKIMDTLQRYPLVVAIIVVLAWSCVYSAADDATVGTVAATAVADDAGSGSVSAREVPYIAVVTADKVNIRSGPAEVFYPVGQAEADDRVVVRKEQHGWAQIEPTRQCFSYISKRYVKLQGVAGPMVVVEPVETAPAVADGAVVAAGEVAADAAVATVEAAGDAESVAVGPAFGADGSVAGESAAVHKVMMGVVVGNYVRVRAGSVKVPPSHADEVQTKLTQGAVVHVIGQRDDYYKIMCPQGSYFWVSQGFLRYVGPADDAQIAELQSQVRYAVTGEQLQTDQIVKQAEKDRQSYQDLARMLAAERDKPLSQQEFGTIRARLDELVAQTQSPSVKASSQSLERQLVRCETAVKLWRVSREQNEHLKLTLAKINGKIETLMAVHNPPQKKAEDMVVKGRLAYSAIFTAPNRNRRFLVLDENERIIYYAVSGREGLDLCLWVDKAVSMVGKVQYDAFGKIRVLKVGHIIELPPGH